MDSEKINELLNKYWNCETTLEEEKHLQEYFRSIGAPETFAETANLFRYFEERKKQKLTDINFEAQILKKIKKPKGQSTSLIYNTMRIAAGIIVLVLAVWLVRMEVRKTSPADVTDTYNDPKIAFEETKKALMMISKSFSTAEEQAKKINLFNEAQKDIRKEESKVEL